MTFIKLGRGCFGSRQPKWFVSCLEHTEHCYKECLKSISSFINSGIQCDKFWNEINGAFYLAVFVYKKPLLIDL